MGYNVKLIVIGCLLLLSFSMLSGAYLRYHPVTLSQPDGTKLELFATGDEFYNWLHDKDGYTVKQNDRGWYVFMDKNSSDELVFTSYLAGKDNPSAKNLSPWTNIAPEKMGDIRKKAQSNLREINSGRAPSTGTFNNLAVFIRFSDQTEFGQSLSTYSSMFNGTTGNTMQSYFLEASYSTLDISTTYYPTPTTNVVSWQDSNPRAYYSPYSATNTIGYSGDTQRQEREFTLLVNATNGVSSQIPAGLNLDGDNDGMVDNVCFIIKGNTDGWAELLWPHRWSIYDRYVYINSKRVYDFNFQLSEHLASSGVGVLCHEMFHSLGAPDLYHYTSNGIAPVGSWDLMENNANPPQHMGAFMKYKYGGWISSIPEISVDGNYSLNPLTSATNNCYKIPSTVSTTEYYVVEYRRATGTFESSLPGSGMLIYRINTAAGNGNASGPPDEVYLYRPNGTTTVNGTVSSANYSLGTGRTAINSTTNPIPFLSNGTNGGLDINNIGTAGATISFVLGNPIPGAPSCTIDSPANGTVFDVNSTIPVNVTAADADGAVSGVAFYINNVFKYNDTTAPYSWVWNTAGYSGGSYTIKVIATDNSSIEAIRTVSVLLLAPPDEGFESNSFTQYPWDNTSTIPWTIQSQEKYSGTYAAKSGAIGDNTSTSLSVTLNVTSAGVIAFGKKVSSESGWDFLTFYIDDVQQGQWSGAESWSIVSYPVTTGLHTFRWTYAKDTNTVSGSDCAWLDHIVFPAWGQYFAPPQNLGASSGNGFVDLAWQAPESGTPTGYRVYRDGALLTTVLGLSYHDTAVVNGTIYSYYVIAAYAGGASNATDTVQATPSEVSYVTLGTGTTVTTTNTLSPINNTYRSIHGQSVYTKAELNNAGVYGPVYITKFGFYIVSAPNLALANFVVRIKHTSATNVASWINATNLQTVYSNAAYMPTAGGYDMLNLSTPFLWNGADNIVVDTAFGVIATHSNTGTMQTSTLNNGYMRNNSDTVNQTSVFSGGAVRGWRPNIKLGVAALTLSAPVISQITRSLTSTTIQWGSVANSGGYKIYRATSPEGPFTYIGSSTTLQFADSDNLPKAFYRVISVYSLSD